MIRVIRQETMGKSEQGWLHSTFHFSFAEYYNPQNIQFGTLRVVNDDVFDAGGGFDTHPHKDMEIISYVIDGVLTHRDSMKNVRDLRRGQVQYMSAGTGVTHSEFNLTDKSVRFLQIWVYPDTKGYKPNYGDFRFKWEDRENKWLKIASGSGESEVKIHQDMEISVVSLLKGQEITYDLKEGRQAYLILIEGRGNVNNHDLNTRDAAEIKIEAKIKLCALESSHFILFDMNAPSLFYYK